LQSFALFRVGAIVFALACRAEGKGKGTALNRDKAEHMELPSNYIPGKNGAENRQTNSRSAKKGKRCYFKDVTEVNSKILK
jgi:hypothetical protein